VSEDRIAVLVSGGGRSLENLAGVIARGELRGRIALVLSNTSKAFALERAARLSIPSVVVDPERKLTPEEFSRDAFAAIESFGCEIAVMAGFLRLLRVPERWAGRVLNIHPALLPAFGGKGYYGNRVHEAVLASGVKETGCTVHYVDNEYDHGPVILQRRIEVRAGDTVETLAERVFEEEKLALPEALRRHLSRAPDALGRGAAGSASSRAS
jgi:formyltetrahydrofolate-dependent phosphoribosylglycinamide formyltransferase